MKTQSLINLFKQYDLAFEAVCDQLHIENRPSWREKWFYRYLCINPVPYVLSELRTKNSGINYDAEKLNEAKKNEISSSRALSQLNFYIQYRNLNFHKWWFLHALPAFKGEQLMMKKVNFDLVFFMKEDGDPELSEDEIQEKLFNDWILENKETLKNLKTITDYGNYFLYAIPKYGHHIDVTKEIHLGMKSDFKNHKHIIDSKMPERTVIDIFKIFEFRALTGNDDLLTIAIQTDALKFSRGTVGSSLADSSDSVKSGISRLFNLGKILIRNTSYVKFPMATPVFNDEREIGANFVIDNYFDYSPQPLFERLKLLHDFSYDEMCQLIKSDLSELQRSGISLN